MVVECNENQLNWFRRKARATPNEILALLVGRRVSPEKLVVTSFKYPLIKTSSPTSINPDYASYESVYEVAKLEGLKVLGSIHSHPNCLPVLSHADIRGHIKNNDLVSGIVEVTNRRTRVVFWRHDSSLPCELTYT